MFEPRKKNAPSEEPMFQCVGMLAAAVGPNLTKLLHDQLDLMFAYGLSEPLRQAREGPCRDLRRRQGQAKDQAICEFVNSIPITSSADPDIATRTEFSRIHHVLIIGYERLRTVM